VFVGEFYQADDGISICFPENIFPVGFHRAFTDEECFSDLPVIVFFFNQLNDIDLAIGQMGLVHFFFTLAISLQFLDHFLAEINTPARYFFQRGHQFLFPDIF
jgi:hypothetical protein